MEQAENNFSASGTSGCLGSQPGGQAPRSSATADRLGASPARGRLDPRHPGLLPNREVITGLFLSTHRRPYDQRARLKPSGNDREGGAPEDRWRA